jgi:RpiB/LacA/LacB family sugar-phosphate isomerase
MKVALATDHAGFVLKEYIKARLLEEGFEVVDCGCHSTKPVDYPPYALSLAWQVVSGNCERGIGFCGNGFTMAMLPNRIPGIRATICHDAFTARTSKEMGDSNIISLGARVVGCELAWELVRIWLNAEFLGKAVPRYARRLAELQELEQLFADPHFRERLEEYVGKTTGACA